MAKRGNVDYEVLSPYRVLRSLDEIASNRVPEDMAAAMGANQVPAWQLLENGVFYFFRQILMMRTVRLGAECLFANEPEGIVLCGREPQPFALLYECKARSDSYAMSSDDVLRYCAYIRKKRQEVLAKYYLHLTHFVIISSSFSGDTEARCRQIGNEGTTLSLCSASILTHAYDQLRESDYVDVALFDPRSIFARGVCTHGKFIGG